MPWIVPPAAEIHGTESDRPPRDAPAGERPAPSREADPPPRPAAVPRCPLPGPPEVQPLPEARTPHSPSRKAPPLPLIWRRPGSGAAIRLPLGRPRDPAREQMVTGGELIAFCAVHASRDALCITVDAYGSRRVPARDS
ncbi:hypothetical protein GCM10010140_04070 [Streptosporangium pseudovulgare]|uniref:Uncharacterized protein n=1 Tax=Streptosporangium pseudovulgare TaxID=35765 RepID=A0ABQ2QGE2_9ACTN|nr:hypothetical protein GCM10010140_04070 [Streptosporangium pseudovulgare]